MYKRSHKNESHLTSQCPLVKQKCRPQLGMSGKKREQEGGMMKAPKERK